MRARTLLSYSCIFFAFIVGSSCQNQEVDAVGETYLDFTALAVQSTDPLNPVRPLASLGRVLFYDRQMSINNTVACASCHKQAYAFADNERFSRGFESRVTSRNSMPIQNLQSIFAFEGDVKVNSSSLPFPGGAGHFFWDGREQDLQKLVLQPVGNHIEMGITDVNALAQKLAALPYYPLLFDSVFESPEITPERISQAITTFVSSINTFDTKFDRYNRIKFEMNGPTLAVARQEVFNSLELEGMMLFQDKYDCNSCHQVQAPNGYIFAGTFANIGLDQTYSDPGLQAVTGDAQDAGKFKIPSLRNVSFTSPYMHDGRFEKLEDVIDHYSEGMADHPNLDVKLQDESGHARSMHISEHEKQALIAFLQTLNDESVIRNPIYSNPFKVK